MRERFVDVAGASVELIEGHGGVFEVTIDGALEYSKKKLHRFPTDEEVALWRDAAAPLKDSWTQAVTGAGHDADAVFQGLVDALEERDAAY